MSGHEQSAAATDAPSLPLAVRGGVTATVSGREFNLLLTVGAQAEIEDKLRLDSINELIPKLQKLNARAVIVAFVALARGGKTPVETADVEEMLLADLLAPVGAAVMRAFPSVEGEEGQDDGTEKKP